MTTNFRTLAALGALLMASSCAIYGLGDDGGADEDVPESVAVCLAPDGHHRCGDGRSTSLAYDIDTIDPKTGYHRRVPWECRSEDRETWKQCVPGLACMARLTEDDGRQVELVGHCANAPNPY